MTDHSFSRDTTSSALLNTDEEGLSVYKQRLALAKQDRQWRRDVENRISRLEALVELQQKVIESYGHSNPEY